jgi:hypothetical protein
MGQAKLRGSFEQRKAEGEARRKAEAQQRAQAREEERKRRLALERAMPADERERLRKSREILAAVFGVVASSDLQRLDFENLQRRFKAG